MDCGDAKDLIESALSGALAPGDRAALGAHLAGCAECRELAASYEGIAQALAGMEMVDVPDRLVARVLAEVGIETAAVRHRASRRRLARRRAAWIASAAAALVVSILQITGVLALGSATGFVSGLGLRPASEAARLLAAGMEKAGFLQSVSREGLTLASSAVVAAIAVLAAVIAADTLAAWRTARKCAWLMAAPRQRER